MKNLNSIKFGAALALVTLTILLMLLRWNHGAAWLGLVGQAWLILEIVLKAGGVRIR